MRPPGTPRLTPADVHNVAFKKPSIGKRGYDEDEVDAFLDLVEEELIRLGEENHELTLRLAAYESGEQQPNGNGTVGLDKAGQSEQNTVTAEQPAVEQPAEQAPAEQAAAEQPAEQAEQPAAEQQTAEPSPEQVVAEAAAQAPPAAAPLADHHMHAARLLGLAEETAQRLTSEAQADAENQRNSARTESEKMVTDARNASDQMLSEAKNQSETMVAEATAAAEAKTRDSQLKAEAMDREAQRKYEEVMGRLSEQRASLEKKIDDLRTYEREYRSRLKGWITEQLAQLDEGAATAVTAPESPGGK